RRRRLGRLPRLRHLGLHRAARGLPQVPRQPPLLRRQRHLRRPLLRVQRVLPGAGASGSLRSCDNRPAMADKRRAKRASNQRSEGARLFREWEGLHADSPPVLYHYTSAQGLLAMVKSGHVWATESRYLNDPREFLHGAELILRVMDQLGERK